MDAFRAELRIVAAVGGIGGVLVILGGGGLALFLHRTLAPVTVQAIPLLFVVGGLAALAGGRLVWRGLVEQGGGRIERGLSRMTLGLMAGGVPGILVVVGLVKSWVADGGTFVLRDAGILVLFVCPLLFAAYAGFVGMRLRIALRAYPR